MPPSKTRTVESVMPSPELKGLTIRKDDPFPEDRKVYAFHFREPAPMITLKVEEPHPTIEGRLIKEAYRITPNRNFHVCRGNQEHNTNAKEEARLLFNDSRNWVVWHLQGGCETCEKAEVFGSTGVVRILTASQEQSANENARGFYVEKKHEYV